MEWIAFIPARAGSRGLENKNIKTLNGVPLYMHTVNCAKKAKAGQIYISTNISEILQGKPQEFVTLIDRKEILCGDDVPMVDVIYNFLTSSIGTKIDAEKTIVLLQPTSPLREKTDILNSLELFKKSDSELLMSVTETENTALKYGLLEDNKFIPISKPEYCFENRQNLPKLFKPNGAIYIFKAGSFRRHKGFPSTSTITYQMPPERSLDIDKLDDFKYVESLLMSNQKGELN